MTRPYTPTWWACMAACCAAAAVVIVLQPGADMCMPTTERYEAMDDMADWGVAHLKDKEPVCLPAVSDTDPANREEPALCEVTL